MTIAILLVTCREWFQVCVKCVIVWVVILHQRSFAWLLVELPVICVVGLTRVAVNVVANILPAPGLDQAPLVTGARFVESLVKHHLAQLAHEHHPAADQGPKLIEYSKMETDLYVLPFPVRCVQEGGIKRLVSADLRHCGRGLRPVALLWVCPPPRHWARPHLSHWDLPPVDMFVF